MQANYDEESLGYPDTLRNGLYVFWWLVAIVSLALFVWWLSLAWIILSSPVIWLAPRVRRRFNASPQNAKNIRASA